MHHFERQELIDPPALYLNGNDWAEHKAKTLDASQIITDRLRRRGLDEYGNRLNGTAGLI